MKKEQLFWAALLFLALGAFFGVYQFYFKQKLADYAKDAIAKKNAEDAYQRLSDTFGGYKPDDVIQAWAGVVQPWKEAVLERGEFFNDAGWREGTKTPEDVAILRFWYDEQIKKERNDLYTKFSQVQGLLQVPPYDQIFTQFGVQTIEDFQGRDITRQDVNRELAEFAFGTKVCNMLLDAKAAYINQVWLWPGRELTDHDGLLRLWTVGLDFGMNMRDFTRFVDDRLRTADRYFNIEGIKIEYSYVGYNVEPLLNIKMLLSMARFVEAKSGTGDDATIPATAVPMGANPNSVASGLGLNKGGAVSQPLEEPTGFAAFWRWFKRNVLYMN